jgi:ABC-type glycerol-3-phosphate transport system permease component
MDRVLLRRSYHKKTNAGKIFLASAKYLALAAVGAYFLFPYFYMVSSGFMTVAESFAIPVRLLPGGIQWSAYRAVLDAELLRSVGNTLFIVAVNVVAVPLSSSLSAYAFAKLKWKRRDAVFGLLMATIMLPGLVIQIPLYVLYVKAGWLNSFLPFTVPSFFGGGIINIFLIRQYMKGIPMEMSNAAKVDGAGEIVIYFRMILPLCIPILTLVVVNTFIGIWNDFMGPYIYITEKSKYTLGLALFLRFSGNYSPTNMPSIQMAACTLMSVPILVLFSFFQRQLIDGVTMGSLKG